MMRALTSTVAIYRMALRIYPAGFRRTFGGDLVRDMQAATEDCWRTAGWRGLGMLWLRTADDLFRSAIVQWTRAGWPIASWVAAAATIAAVAVSWHVYRGAWQRARTHGEDELALLLVAISVVLLLLVCTLAFTRRCAPVRRPRH